MPFYLALLLAFVRASTLNAPAIPNIPEVRSAGGVATLALRAALDPSGRPAFFWQGREVAPTIRVRPGDVIRIHYENELPEVCGLGMVSDSNLHFHGLVTAPVRPGDEVIVTNVAPHHAIDYAVKIGPRQPPGLYWYHPHPHLLSNWQIGNGMAGAIVVEGIANELPQLAGLRERVVVLRDIPVNGSFAAAFAQTRPRLPKSQRSAAPSSLIDSDDFQGDAPCGVETDGQPTINGFPSVSIGIRPHERQLWRILNASAGRHFDLTIPGARIDLVALDGVPLGDFTGARRERTVDHVLIPPGSRAEVVVTGPEHPLLLVSQCFDAGARGDENPGVIFAELVDDGDTMTTARVAPPLAHVASPSLGLAGTRVATQRALRFQEDSKRFYIDNLSYKPSLPPLIVARTGTVEEWTVENATDEVHVFHLHQAHFAVEGTNEWRDTIDLAPRSRVRIIVDFRDPVIRGTFLVHCHLADHEDGGMMAKVRVL
ncbi:MAG: multicopper oxidase family protein [Candidatus Eremiobacteraeota bacterium]|nr:multicopper oxidase family protein [Candidatus Eremiobacteraeota bacterium]